MSSGNTEYSPNQYWAGHAIFHEPTDVLGRETALAPVVEHVQNRCLDLAEQLLHPLAMRCHRVNTAIVVACYVPCTQNRPLQTALGSDWLAHPAHHADVGGLHCERRAVLGREL